MKGKIAVLALLVGASFSTNTFALSITVEKKPNNTLPITVEKKNTYLATCSTGNFKGEIKYRKGQDHNLRPWIEVSEYKITRRNGQQGGNKANINIYPYVGYTEPGTRPTWSSQDNRKQDGQWRNLGATVKHSQWEYPEYYHAKVKFIFDKPGNDPSCTATIN